MGYGDLKETKGRGARVCEGGMELVFKHMQCGSGGFFGEALQFTAD